MVSPKARRLALRLDPSKRVVNLVVPKRTSMVKAYDFALTHLDWITEKIERLPMPIPYAHGSVIPVLNSPTLINITFDDALKRTSIHLKDNELIIKTNKEDPSTRIARFLKAHAHGHFLDICREKADKVQKRVKVLSLRDTKSRWGSCSNTGNLSLSWRLIFAPFEAYDYVIAHEVAHLVHLNHSERFWDLCTELSTDFSTGHRWMKNNAHELLRYGQVASKNA